MTELAQEGLRGGKPGTSCSGLAAELLQHGEQALRGQRVAVQACALETASELRARTLPPTWSKDAHLYSCPLANEGRQEASSKLRLLHRTMLAAGYVRLDSPLTLPLPLSPWATRRGIWVAFAVLQRRCSVELLQCRPTPSTLPLPHP